MLTITREQVLEAAKGAGTISEVARRLGLCGTKLSGSTAARLRVICPGLDGLMKAGKPQPSTESTGQFREVSKIREPDPGNPYRPGSTYAVIFREGSRRFMAKEELIEIVSLLTGKSTECTGYSLTVLCH